MDSASKTLIGVSLDPGHSEDVMFLIAVSFTHTQ